MKIPYPRSCLHSSHEEAHLFSPKRTTSPASTRCMELAEEGQTLKALRSSSPAIAMGRLCRRRQSRSQEPQPTPASATEELHRSPSTACEPTVTRLPARQPQTGVKF